MNRLSNPRATVAPRTDRAGPLITLALGVVIGWFAYAVTELVAEAVWTCPGEVCALDTLP